MSYEQALRDHDLMLMNPPVAEVPDEICDRCGRDFGNDWAIKVKGTGRLAGYHELLCDRCAVQVERCDQCGFLRCVCES